MAIVDATGLPDPADADCVFADFAVPVATQTVPVTAGVRGFVRAAQLVATDSPVDRLTGPGVLYVQRGRLVLAPDTLVDVGAVGAQRRFIVLGEHGGPVGIFERWWVTPDDGAPI